MLLATVVGSGIMAENLAGGNVAIALLGNTIPTGAILVVLIMMFGPVSGAHFNPAVTLAFALRKEISIGYAGSYIVVQAVAAISLGADLRLSYPYLPSEWNPANYPSRGKVRKRAAKRPAKHPVYSSIDLVARAYRQASRRWRACGLDA